MIAYANMKKRIQTKRKPPCKDKCRVAFVYLYSVEETSNIHLFFNISNILITFGCVGFKTTPFFNNL